ncbi:50S ribosomal protein L30 [candidate division KSB1 bacterium]|nr:50S ribosomal protein L30 [candidate division KSB1 bacterium]MBL7095006.1 50S ribosomal protein L30 [candidate division KSB1 bacterium]
MAKAKQKKLKISLKKSIIGYNIKQKVTVRTLGLRKLHQTVEHGDTPQIRGMINKVSHLVEVEEI